METAEASKSLNVQMYRLTSLELFSSLRDQGIVSTSRSPWFEGRFQMRAKVQPETRLETFPAGSVRVPTDQPLGDLVVALLEPESNDSFLGWGFFPEILQQPEYIEGYVAAPMAERMLAEDPQLKSAFEAKLRADSKFAANPSARLDWFYQRSRFYDERYLLYPVGIEPAEALGSSP
jgi:hypothetical protein